MLSNPGCPVPWGSDGFQPSCPEIYTKEKIRHVGPQSPTVEGHCGTVGGLKPRVQQSSTHCTLAPEGFEPLTKGSWATHPTNCTLWHPPSTCSRITMTLSSRITSRVNSRITSGVSSRIWCGAIWRVRHLRADSVVWLSHTSSVWPWSDAPKVQLCGIFLGSLRHLPPWMKNQHGSMRKNLYRKKIISQLSACDVTRVISLDTNNQA